MAQQENKQEEVEHFRLFGEDVPRRLNPEYFNDLAFLCKADKPPVKLETKLLMLEQVENNFNVFMVLMDYLQFERGVNPQGIEWVRASDAVTKNHHSQFKHQFVYPFKHMVMVYRKVEPTEANYIEGVDQWVHKLMIRQDLILAIDRIIVNLARQKTLVNIDLHGQINIWIELFDQVGDWLDQATNCNLVKFDDFRVMIDDMWIVIEDGELNFSYASCPIFNKYKLREVSREFVEERLLVWNEIQERNNQANNQPQVSPVPPANN